MTILVTVWNFLLLITIKAIANYHFALTLQATEDGALRPFFHIFILKAMKQLFSKLSFDSRVLSAWYIYVAGTYANYINITIVVDQLLSVSRCLN